MKKRQGTSELAEIEESVSGENSKLIEAEKARG